MFDYLHRPDPGLTVGVAFSDRAGGVSADPLGPLNLGRTDADDVGAVRENFARVRAALGVSRIVTVDQVHGAEVLVVDDAVLADWTEGHELGSAGTGPPLAAADAMVTDRTDVALCVRVADCLPVLLADPDSGVIGAAHAGRVGLVGGVLPATVAAMRRLGARHIRAWLGPHICGECYEVPEQMRDQVAADLPAAYAVTSWGTPALDLGAAAAGQLAALGCRVQRRGACTRTSPRLHSHRRDGAGAGRLGALVWLAARP